MLKNKYNLKILKKDLANDVEVQDEVDYYISIIDASVSFKDIRYFTQDIHIASVLRGNCSSQVFSFC